MPKEKTLGFDGFPIEFFTKKWEIVKHDLIAAIKDFFATGKI